MTILEITNQYRFTAGFGPRLYKGSDGAVITDFHWGIDYATPTGVAIHAHMDCKLVLSGTYGKEVILNLEALDGSCNWTIGHCSEALYKPGSVVKAGALIGKTGNSGNSTGPHAHIEYDKGRFKGSVTANHQAGTTIDPLPIIKGSGGASMDNRVIFRSCFITQANRWPNEEEIKAWEKSGMEPYAWVQQYGHFPMKDDRDAWRAKFDQLAKHPITPIDPQIVEKAQKFDEIKSMFRGLVS